MKLEFFSVFLCSALMETPLNEFLGLLAYRLDQQPCFLYSIMAQCQAECEFESVTRTP